MIWFSTLILLIYYFLLKPLITPNENISVPSNNSWSVEEVVEVNKKKPSKKNDNGLDLSSINEEVDKLKKDKLAKETKLKNEIEDILSKYLEAVNADKDILSFISKSSIEKIEKETKDTYSKFTDKEKSLFLKDMTLIGYPKNSFNIEDKWDIALYINTIVKSWIKSIWQVKDFKITKIDDNVKIEKENQTLIYIEYTVLYKDTEKVKELKLFLEWDKKLFKISL